MGVTGVAGAFSLSDVLDLANLVPDGVLVLELQGLPFGVWVDLIMQIFEIMKILFKDRVHFNIESPLE